MNTAPANPDLINRLAAEYVLGTLRGGARRRLERWRATSAQVDERCRFWEEGLLPLLLALQPVPPPTHLWPRIRARLHPPAAGQRRRFGVLALAASVVLVATLATLLYWRTLGPGRALETATISAASGTLLWQVEVYGRPGAERLSVRAGTLAAPPAGRDYELWALPKTGAPVSLGLLPYRHSLARRALSVAQRQALAHAAQLAVSVEPPGGSPTGQPTGAVVFVVPLRAVS
jgi:anti-sigma-K factor RskA